MLYAPLSRRQREVYDAVVKGSLRGLLAGVQPGKGTKERDRERIEREIEEDEKMGRLGMRTRKSRASIAPAPMSTAEVGAEHALKTKCACPFYRLSASPGAELRFLVGESVKKVNNMHLQNVVMQLRKVCSHPFLFDWPLDERTNQPVVDEQLVDASGKMMVLERLLDELFARGHKVLVFSQFVTMLDVIEVRLLAPSRPRFCVIYSCMMTPLQDWAHEFKHWPFCRIDGSTGPLERRAEMDRFQKGGNGPDAPRLFLLSTRAGGLGINLTAADTVVFYDQDWVRTFLCLLS